MKFGDLQSIHFLWLVVAGAVFCIWAFRRRRQDMERFAESRLLGAITPSLYPARQKVRVLVILFALVMIIVALMRPQWGFEWKEVRRSGLDILIALDTSRSMLAEDVKPNRLERSRLAVRDLIRKLGGDRVGLIAFAGNAFLQCPLTSDYDGFLLALNDLDVNTIPEGGTSLASTIRVALESFSGGKKKYKVLIIISDGEDHEGTAHEMAEKAKAEGIKVFTIGIGTREGELIPITDESGSRGFLKDSGGIVVKSRLDEELLQNIALTTGGSYVRSSQTAFGLDLIYDEQLSKMDKEQENERMVKKYHERFEFPLVAALILLCLEPLIRERREVRVKS